MLCSSTLQLNSCAVVCFALYYYEQVKYFPNKKQFTRKEIVLKAFFVTKICCVCLLSSHFGCFDFLTWHKILVFSQQNYWWKWTDMIAFLCRWEPGPKVLTLTLCITGSEECHHCLQIYPCPWSDVMGEMSDCRKVSCASIKHSRCWSTCWWFGKQEVSGRLLVPFLEDVAYC